MPRRTSTHWLLNYGTCKRRADGSDESDESDGSDGSDGSDKSDGSDGWLGTVREERDWKGGEAEVFKDRPEEWRSRETTPR